ncbi:hypothetical protein NA56DRAFT_721991 [Hyaloscypha hepaticicola]|uniref:Heterokaryon incompatibility domain-containing protein n=1 Tax=Hyaloscypha hepaticicola TaxID=2082293 RepID=A0A2J6QP88_9HELO|nr:hypothetical protein NA56DRAFT_721991 [Hyaloscypha hepaticicola]
MSSQATVEPSEVHKVTVTSCRRCASKFQYELRSGGKATIIIVSDASKLRRLMELVGPANAWLDIISIDQDDEQDKATQIAAMGDIYSKASWADTAVHLRASIMQSLDTTLLSRRIETLRKLAISKIKAVTSLTNIPEFISEFSLAVTGKPEESDLGSLILDVDMSEMGDKKAENMAFAPLLGQVRALLESIPREHLVKSRLVTASWVQVEQTRTPAGHYSEWP